MSSTTGDTHAFDSYPTPPWAIERLLERVWLPGGRIWEPCAGEGRIIAEMRKVERFERADFWATEIQERHRPSLLRLADTVRIGDILDPAVDAAVLDHGVTCDLAITNPPYSLAFEVLRRCRAIADWTALLLRVGFLEGGASDATEDRAAFLDADQPDVYIIPNRPPFARSKKTGKFGTDSATYAWMVWTPERRRVGSVSRLALTPKDVRAEWLKLQREKCPASEVAS